MRTHLVAATALALVCGFAVVAPSLAEDGKTKASQARAVSADWRDIDNGFLIPDEDYADQPYVVKDKDGAWVAVITTGPGEEGHGGQHIVALRSLDQGKTWSKAVDIEPAKGPEASYVVPLVTASGRIYAVYTYNEQNIRHIPDAGAMASRVDTLGTFAFRFSDDGGRTWSARHKIPQRAIADDAHNNFDGKVLFFWTVAKPELVGDAAYIGYSKVTRWGEPNVLRQSRGFILKSPNIGRETDPAKIVWEVLPGGDDGLLAPKGAIAEEVNITALSTGTLMAVYRTTDGYLCISYSEDQGRTWSSPAYGRYGPGRRALKNPRAFTYARRFSNGKYLLWFHNQGGEALQARDNWATGADVYQERNPGWVVGGVERNGRVEWSEPEILLYARDTKTRISYPDFVEDKGRFFITETQKTVARTHPVPNAFLDVLWGQFDRDVAPKDGVAVKTALPPLSDLAKGGGFTLDFDLKLRELTIGQTVFDNRNAQGRGVAVNLGARSNLVFTMSDGTTTASWESDPGLHEGVLRTNRRQHVSIIVDGGPKIVQFMIDGVLNDGGPIRQYGWGRFDPALSAPDSLAPLRGGKLMGEWSGLRVFPRALMAAEAKALHRATPANEARHVED